MSGLPEVGTIVEAQGLQNFPMLNGVQGKIIKHQAGDKGVLPLVSFPAPHGKLMLKPQNFKVISAGSPEPVTDKKQSDRAATIAKYPVGAEIEAVGLKTQHHLNGLRGRIEAHHDSPDGSVKLVVNFGPPQGLIGLRPANINMQNSSTQQLPTVSRTASTSLSPTARKPSVAPSSHRPSVPPTGSPRPSIPPTGRTPSGSVAPSITSRRQSTISDVSKGSSRKVKRESFTPPSGLVTYQERYSTFASWPSHLQSAQVNPKELAFAGFYHNPSQKDPDKCTCFTCGYSLVQWSPGDIPWSEHSKHVPNCAFVVAHKASLKASAALAGKGKKGKDLDALDEDGYLKKQKPGKLSSGWDDRYFALRGTTLYYYEEKAAIDLARGCECSAVPHDSCSFTVNAVGQKRDAFVLKAVNEQDRSRWVEALNGSKKRDMSKEDIEVLGGFETAEAEIRTQLVFDAAREATMLAGACIVNSLRISSVIGTELKERIVREEIKFEEEADFNRLQRVFEKRKTNLRLSEHLSRVIRQDEKRVAYNAWRLAAAPNSQANALSSVEVTERDARHATAMSEAFEKNEIMTHQLKLTCADLSKALRDNASLRNELQTVRSTPVTPDLPAPGTRIYVHGLKNMAVLNGQEAKVTEGQKLPDGTNVVLVEFINNPTNAPMLLKLQNIYTPPSDELVEMIKKPALTKLDESLKKITELEELLQQATSKLEEIATTEEQAAPQVKEVPTADPAVVKELDESKEKLLTLGQEMANLSAQLEKERMKSKDVSTLEEGFLHANPSVVYSPVPTPGSRVVAHGLKSMESLNGLIGEVKETTALPDGTPVPLITFTDPDTTVMIRKENLTSIPNQYVLDKIMGDMFKPQLEELERLKLANAALQQEVDAKPAPAVALPAIGGKVIAHGLKSNSHLNGQEGQVLEHQTLPDAMPAVVVKFDSETLMLRMTNFSQIPVPEVCDYVRKQLNAEVGELNDKIKELQSELLVAQNQVQSQSDLAKASAVPAVGVRVVAHGLNNRKELNGAQGVVQEHGAAPDGTTVAVVKFDSPDVAMMLKSKNITVFPPPDVCECILQKEQLKRQELLEEMQELRDQLSKTTTTPQLPNLQTTVVVHGVRSDSEINSQEGMVVEHQVVKDGSQVAVVDINGKMVMLKPDQMTPMPREEVVECIVRNEKQARQAAESALEMEQMNNKAAQQNEVRTQSTVPENGAIVVPYNMQNSMQKMNGKLAVVEDSKRLGDGTTALNVVVGDMTIMVKLENLASITQDAYDQIQAAAKESDNSELFNLQNKLLELESSLEQAGAQSEKYKLAVTQHEEEADSMRESVAALSARTEELEKENAEHSKAEDTQAAAEAEALQEKINELQDTIDALKVSNEDLAKQHKALQDEDLIRSLSKQLMDTQHQCNELTGKIAHAEEQRNVAELALESRDLKLRPGDEVMLKVPVGEPPVHGKVIKMDGTSAACVKFENDTTPSVGSVINLVDIVMVPPEEVCELLTRKMAAKLEASENCLVLEQRKLKEMEDKLLKLEEEQGKSLEHNQIKLQHMLSSAALQTDKCEFCVELQTAVNELLRKTEEERTAQRQRQERMLQAIQEEAIKRTEEEARLYEMIGELQQKAEHRQKSASPPIIQAPKLLPDTELHNIFEEMKKDAAEKNAAFGEQEASLLAMVDEAVRNGKDPSQQMEALNALRVQTLQDRKDQAEKEKAILQAIQQRREGEATLVSDMHNRADAGKQQLLENEKKMLGIVRVRDDQTAEYQQTIRELRDKIEQQARNEKELLKSLEKIKPGTGRCLACGAAEQPTIAPTDVDVLLESVSDPKLRAVLEGLRREGSRPGSDDLRPVVERLQRKVVVHDENEAMLNREINELKRRLGQGEPVTPSYFPSPSTTASPAYSSPRREFDQADEVASLRSQLNDARNSFNTLQAEYNQAAEALASSSARLNALQSQSESMQHLVEAKQADIDNLTFVIKRVQQLPVLQTNARKLLQDIVPLGEADKVSWLFHFYDRDSNGRWSKEEMSAVRNTDSTHWTLLCKALNVDVEGPGLSLDDVEGMYKLEDKFVLHADYETAREKAIPGVDSLLSTYNYCHQVMTDTEAYARELLSTCMKLPVNKHANNGPITNMLRAVSEEADQQRKEQAEHEEKVMALLRGDKPVRGRSSDPDVRGALEQLTKQVEAQRGELVQFQRSMSPNRAEMSEKQALQKQISVLQLKVATLQNALDEKHGSEALAPGVPASPSRGDDAPSATPVALRTTLASMLAKSAAKRTLGGHWVRWRMFAGKQQGTAQVAEEEAMERRHLTATAEECAKWQSTVMEMLRDVAHGNQQLMRLNGSVPIEIYEQSSRHSITAEEIGSRIELVRWKLDDGVLHWQMAEVGGILHQLQQTVASVHIPVDVRARLSKLTVGYHGIGAMQKRIQNLEGKIEWLRGERDKAVLQASTADARLSEYRSRIHKLRDEARQRNTRGKSELRTNNTVTATPSPARDAVVSKWSAEIQSPSPSPSRGWE
eukprot:TRINITY_DN9702_c2_g1_i1.p1 TRINITY_DN9702_c2_g1~~TRINITY_DN9702_c2_g1_i1.p1  ORF type:complete len:2501 (+),score=692.47 TRINITY_DN9702_c2_g1_i1:69-7571(+)